MNWLEIITVEARASREKIKIIELCGNIRLPRKSGGSLKLLVYGNSLSTEISIHIHSVSQSAPNGSLGRALSKTLGDYGLVSHKIYVEHSGSLPGNDH